MRILVFAILLIGCAEPQAPALQMAKPIAIYHCPEGDWPYPVVCSGQREMLGPLIDWMVYTRCNDVLRPPCIDWFDNHHRLNPKVPAKTHDCAACHPEERTGE